MSTYRSLFKDCDFDTEATQEHPVQCRYCLFYFKNKEIDSLGYCSNNCLEFHNDEIEELSTILEVE